MRVKRFKQYEMIEVNWIDIVERSGWRTVKEAAEEDCIGIVSIGYFIANKKGTLNIASCVSRDNDCNVTSIPWGVIKQVRRLTYNEEPIDGEC